MRSALKVLPTVNVVVSGSVVLLPIVDIDDVVRFYDAGILVDLLPKFCLLYS